MKPILISYRKPYACYSHFNTFMESHILYKHTNHADKAIHIPLVVTYLTINSWGIWWPINNYNHISYSYSQFHIKLILTHSMSSHHIYTHILFIQLYCTHTFYMHCHYSHFHASLTFHMHIPFYTYFIFRMH